MDYPSLIILYLCVSSIVCSIIFGRVVTDWNITPIEIVLLLLLFPIGMLCVICFIICFGVLCLTSSQPKEKFTLKK